MSIFQGSDLVRPDQQRLVPALELLRALIAKELKVKYKRSVLGFFWSLLTPVALTGIYLFVFVYVYKVPKPDFVLFLLSGLLPWNYFNMAILAATVSVVENGSLIRKVFFPRILLPIATVASNLINFLMGLGVLMVILMIAGRPIWAQLHWLVVAVVLQTALLVGLSLILSIGNVYFRDIQQIISILMLLVFFATPVVYELGQVPIAFKPMILANPLSAVMEIYRSALFLTTPPNLGVVALGLAESLLILALGLRLFSKLSPHLAKEV